MLSFAVVKKKAVWLLAGQISPGDSIRQFRIDETPFTVGRHPDASLMIPVNSVSSTHAELREECGLLWVNDFGSTNGTYVNGIRIHGPTPLGHGDLLQFAVSVFRVEMETIDDSKSLQTEQSDSADRALAMIQLDRMMSDRSVETHFQPIVAIANRERLGFEMLARSRLVGLYTPGAMFDAANALDVERQLTRMLRTEGLRQAVEFPGEPLLFANTHPVETNDPEHLVESLEQLRRMDPDASLILEIHECAVTDLGRMQEIRDVLRELNMGLAYDDFGAGHARLVELVEVPPDYLKFDISLIRNLHEAPAQRKRLIGSLVDMIRELGIPALAKGVEREDEHQACVDLGFDYAQGFLYGRPRPAMAWL